MLPTLPTTQKARVEPWKSNKARAIAEVTRALQQQWQEGRRLLAMRQRAQAMQERPTTKKDTHRPAKLTKGTLSSFNAVALRNCPGGDGKTPTSIIRMIEAPETGAVIVNPETQRGQSTLLRLQNSAKNCNTTQGNYNSTYTRR